MQLTLQDARLFYDLMWSLQNYVNQKHHIHADVTGLYEYADLDIPEKKPVRDALYADIGIIDSFIRDNPQGLSEMELTIVSSWRKFIEGNFFIERLLKKYAVFIKGDDVYGVVGLTQPIDGVVAPLGPPVYVKTVLLPFKGQIIYDGIIEKYSISFGAGVSATLKETYMTAKQNKRLITTLDPRKRQEQKEKQKESVRDYTDDLEELARTARKLRGGGGQPAIYTRAFKLVRESIKLAQAAVHDPKDIDSLIEGFNKVDSTLQRTGRVIDRTEP